MTTLPIPVRIQGLFLEHDQQVSAPSADFSQLPWFDEKQGTDVNFTTPFISKYCLRQPFQGPDSLLGKGVHLHFVIPHFLGRRVPEGLPGAQEMPAVPNRWIITRKNKDGNMEKQWFIESDYIHHESHSPTYYSCTIPFHQGRPYRHLGRVREFSGVLPPEGQASQYFRGLNNHKPMTALGAGDIHFASFYPNCNTAFGLFDPEGELDAKTTYTVQGWHSVSDDDLIFQSIKTWNQKEGYNNVELQKDLKASFGLLYDPDDSIGSPLTHIPSSVFYGAFQFDGKPADPDHESIKVAVGSTGTEALSAFVASELAGDPFASEFAGNKRNIENILESALMFPKLDGEQVDVGPKFDEARHTAGFRPSHGGHLWKIQAQAPNKAPDAKEALDIPSLPAGLGEKLDALNQAQAKYHHEHQKIVAQQRQLYADWIKYMEARYPPEANSSNDIADQIMYFLSQHGISPLLDQMAHTGILSYDQDKHWEPVLSKYDLKHILLNDGINLNPESDKSPEEQLNDRFSATSNQLVQTIWQQWETKLSGGTVPKFASKVVEAWNDLTQAIDNENNQRHAQSPQLFLNRIDGPRFWEPKAPVVLLSGLEEGVSKVNYSVDLLEGDRSNESFIEELYNKNLQKYSEQIWSPFLMDWEFDLHQTTDLQKGSFSEDAILSNFKLDGTSADFLPNQTTSFQQVPGVFSGTVLMSAHTRSTYLYAIEAFFSNFLKKHNVELSESSLKNFLMEVNWETACTNISATDILQSPHSPNPYQKLQEAYRKIEPQHFLSQTLDGFYESCVQLRKVTQFPIAEPIGFEYERQFTELVKATVQLERHMSPEIAFDFNPLPSGKFYLNRLQVLDNFGISTPIRTNYDVPFAEPLCTAANEAFLKPRIAQPARLSLRWLSASDSVTPTNDDPITSPVCGWLVNNYLDNSLMVYDATGNGLGSLNQDMEWQVVPWKTAPSSETEIANIHLRQVIQKIKGLPNFLSDTENALHHISPHEALQHPLRSDLIGKPMAVVRAAVGLELQGIPHLDQSWASLLHDLQNCHLKPAWGPEERNNQNWTTVAFPCRIGEHMQLNDGLIGYWVENEQTPYGDFIAPQTENQSGLDQGVNEYTPGIFQGLSLKLNAEKTYLSMIMDPHGLIHATTGILPTKALSIPPEHYLPQLKKLKVWFRSSPILQPQALKQKVQLDLPKIPELEWRWWDPKDGTSTIEKYNQNPDVKLALKEGWLLLEEPVEDQKSNEPS
ncbi:MAG: hypothetical protein R8G66_02065 [Cytophagales bacterium]|nr:hypothetical protein [Cytophagales bacterium]